MEGKRTIHLMGTVIQLFVIHDLAEALLDATQQKLIDYERRFSANRQDSELMAVNQCAGLRPKQVSSDLYELIKIGKENSLATGSFLNIALGPLIQTWRVGFADAKVPTQEVINQCLPVINPANIELDDNAQTVYLTQKKMALDLGALAKGYFADQIIAFWKAQGAVAGYIDLGGNVLTFGAAPKHVDGAWRVGIQNPFLARGNYVAVLKVQDLSVVTSGIYERKLQVNGQTFHHIFDRQTGYPLQSDVASLTIVSKKSIDGEIWTTRLFGKDSRTIIKELLQLPAIEGLVITKSGELAWTPGLNHLIEI